MSIGNYPSLDRFVSPSRAEQLRQYGREFRRHPKALIGLAIIVGLVTVAILAPLIAPYGPAEIMVGDRSEPPSLAHPFGTDNFGRDVFSRVILGSQITLYIGSVSVALAMVVGVPVGAIGGYYGGYTDEALMRLMDAIMSFPPVLLGLVVIAALGPTLTNVLIAIGFVFTPYFARVTRSAVIEESERDYVDAAKARGEGNLYLVFREILPNSMAPIIVQASLSFGLAVLAASALSFLGLGAQPPTPSWGLMISNGRGYLTDAPWMSVFPGLAIGISVLGYNMLGDALREILDPKVSTAEATE
jgi:peptide/nickel transport system permease protein